MALRPIIEAADILPVIRGAQGPVGEKGEKGDKGDKGDQGPMGPKGLDGAKIIETKIELDTTALDPIQQAVDSLAAKLAKLEKRRPEYVGGGGGGSGAAVDDEIVVTFDGGGNTLVPGDTRTYYTTNYNATIVGWYLTGDPTGSLVIDVWKKRGGGLPTVADTIVASAPPTLSGSPTGFDIKLPGWATQIAKGDIFNFNINSVSTVTKAVLTIKIVVTP